MNTAELEIERTAVALILAALDGECEQRTHEMTCRHDPHFAVKVAHNLAHHVIDTIDPAEIASGEFRASVAECAAELAAHTPVDG